MINKEDFELLLNSSEVRISYSFLFENNELKYLGEEFVDLSKPDSPATKMFHKNYFADRFSVTLGPLAMTHDPKYKYTRPLFNNRPGYFDLRKNNNKLIIEPNEVLSVSTNEKIIVGKNYGAYLLPRLRNVDSGILYIPSYIDPFWNGILQAVIVNLSSHPQELSICEGLAICRFYQTSNSISPEIATRFPSKSHHFGQSWPKIIEENAEPFPRRKEPITVGTVQKIKSQIRNFYYKYTQLITKLGYGGGIILLLILGVTFWNNIQRIEKIDQNNNILQKDMIVLKDIDIPNINNKIEDLYQTVAISDITEIEFTQGEQIKSKKFSILRPFEKAKSIWCEVISVDKQDYKVRGLLNKSHEDKNKTIITIEVSRSSIKNSEKIQVKWLITG